MYRKLRYLRIVVSVAFLALLTFAIIDTAFALTPLGKMALDTQLVPAILTASVAWVILWVIVTISFGRVYCSTVCPLGTLMDASCKLSRLGAAGRKRHYSYSPPLDMLRIGIASVVAACLFAGIHAVVRASDPFTIYRCIVSAVTRPAMIGFSSLAIAALAIVAISAIAWHKGRLVCNSICPAGALLGLLGRQPIYRVDINTDLCIHCGKCEDVCKASCINLKTCVVDNSRCVMCLDCTAVCPNGAITVRRGRHRLSTPLMQMSGQSS